MNASLWLILLLFLGQAASDDDTALTVRRLVHQLDARELAQRDAAEQQLLELGTAALEFLPEPSDRISAETHQRLDRVRVQLQRDHAAALATPTRVTLSQRLPLSDILAAIRQQTGNQIVDHRAQFGQAADNPALDIDLQNEPFWPALDQILDRAELIVYPYARQPGIALVARPPTAAPRQESVAYSGAFRIQPLHLIAERDLTSVEQRSLRVKLEIAWEPRLNPIALMYSLSDIHAETDEGQDLSPNPSPAEIEASLTPGSKSTSIDIMLKPAQRTARSITQLQGRLRILMPGRTETFRFENLLQASGVEKQRSGTVVRLERVRRNNELWELRIRVSLDDPQQSLESHRDWMYHNLARLEDPAGQLFEPDGLEVTLQTDTAFGMAYLFDLTTDDLKDYTFVYQTPGVMLSQPVEFELHDLELP